MLSFYDGGGLFDRKKSKKTYNESETIVVMKNMLKALAYMHYHKVVHRALKSSNLILMSKINDYDIRIKDFDLATYIKPNEVLKLKCGTPGYKAPEILEDIGYDEKSDIFSAGVIMCELLTGRPVFKGKSPNEILEKTKNVKSTIQRHTGIRFQLKQKV